MGDNGNSNNGSGNTPVPAKVIRTSRGRASLSTSPLARPASLIHMLAGKVQEYLYFPTPDPLYVVLGCIAANMMQGVPVWVMLVGVPASGRTVLLESLANVPKVHIIGAIKSPSALLSGVAQKDKSKHATGGILRQIGARGMMVMKDFTSMLSMPREPMAESIGALREIYDGRWSRPLGTEGGRVLEWRGKLGFLGACTPALDRHYSVTGELGERWMYYRYAETDGYGETIKALGVENPEQMMEELRTLVCDFMSTLDVTWDDNGSGGSVRRSLTSKEKNRLYAIASVAVAARSPVPRDTRTHEVMDIAQKEAPTRLSSALGQMYLGLEAIGLEEGERWQVICRLALDSAPQIRTRIVLALYNVVRWMGDAKGGGLYVRELREQIRCSTRVTANVLQDLSIHGLVEIVEKGKVKSASVRGAGSEDADTKGLSGLVKLTSWCRKHMDLGWRGVGAEVIQEEGTEEESKSTEESTYA